MTYQSEAQLENKLLKTAFGSTVKSLRMDNFIECQIFVPRLKEQIKISKFLSSINLKIEKEKEKLYNLKELKKGLIQKMFV